VGLIELNLRNTVWHKLRSLEPEQEDRLWRSIEAGEMEYRLDRNSGRVDVLIAGGSSDDTVDRLWRFIASAEIVDNRAKVVAGTKTLHHILPDLAPPMDREWTGHFFEWSLNDLQNRQRQIFDDGFRAFVEMAREVQPFRYVGEGWRTSATKLLDNGSSATCSTRKER
jgi:hypothetical protein